MPEIPKIDDKPHGGSAHITAHLGGFRCVRKDTVASARVVEAADLALNIARNHFDSLALFEDSRLSRSCFP
jgi:hypothetical protein